MGFRTLNKNYIDLMDYFFGEEIAKPCLWNTFFFLKLGIGGKPFSTGSIFCCPNCAIVILCGKVFEVEPGGPKTPPVGCGIVCESGHYSKFGKAGFSTW